MLSAQVRDALLAAAQVGPFFVLEVAGDSPGRGWLPAADWYRGGMSVLVNDTARRLGTRETRVAASIFQQGFAARLWSPVLASGLLCGIVPALSALVVGAEPPLRLGLAEPGGWLVRSADQVAALSSQAVGRELTALAAALPGRLAAGLLRGNSASAMVGALRVLVAARPDLAGEANRLGRALLHTGGLRAAGELSVNDGQADGRLAFRRNSCCLYYRIPGGGLCGDCCFTRAPAS